MPIVFPKTRHKVVHFSKVSLPCPPPFSAPHRKKEWASSRFALLSALKDICPEWELRSKEDFEIARHHVLKKNERLLVGLSHTGFYGAAVVGWQGPTLLGLGIDIENKGRRLSQGAERFFAQERDAPFFQSRPLLLWTAKEAAYKALWPVAQSSSLTLRDLWVKGESFGRGEKPLGRLSLQEEGELWVAIAFLECAH